MKNGELFFAGYAIIHTILKFCTGLQDDNDIEKADSGTVETLNGIVHVSLRQA